MIRDTTRTRRNRQNERNITGMIQQSATRVTEAANKPLILKISSPTLALIKKRNGGKWRQYPTVRVGYGMQDYTFFNPKYN